MFKCAVVGLILALTIGTGAWAETHSAPPAPDAAARCAALAGKMNLQDAATEIVEAGLVAAAGDLPAYCHIQATVAPAVGIQMQLPATTWNGKFFLFGRGGYCRAISMEDCNEPLRHGYACLITDQGHKSTESDDIWISDNLQAKVDCGFRGTHVAAVAGKAITERYYGKPPAHSYFEGCSTGGRMAMVEAERFPYDFDGIVAGAPPINKAGNVLALAWNALAPLDKNGKQILTAAAVKLVADAAVAQCDMDDGVKDGVIGNPFGCKFDPSALQCKSAASSGCLTAEQVAAVRKLYQGPVNAKGLPLYRGAPLPGSELNWIGAFVADEGKPARIYDSMNDAFRYMNTPERGPNWTLTQLDWDKDYKSVGLFEAYMSDDNPDLRQFKAAGGKLLIYHGLADQLVLPGATVDFYKAVQRVMGGPAMTEDFARLFLIPGMGHCAGGPGATVFDYAQYLDRWVVAGNAPDAIIGAHVRNLGPTAYLAMKQPLDPANVVFTRPVYRFPLLAKYKGSGDANAAANFAPLQTSE